MQSMRRPACMLTMAGICCAMLSSALAALLKECHHHATTTTAPPISHYSSTHRTRNAPHLKLHVISFVARDVNGEPLFKPVHVEGRIHTQAGPLAGRNRARSLQAAAAAAAAVIVANRDMHVPRRPNQLVLQAPSSPLPRTGNS